MNKRVYEIWFVTGSQHLYGEETLKQVEANSKEIAAGLDNSIKVSVKILYRRTLTTPDAITKTCLEASTSENCIGLIAWMHTFSPAKMWINGLKLLHKPYVHLHTQFNRDIPWKDIDMNFMNLNQSAHGDREFGFINARMGIDRKVIVGHWKDKQVAEEIDVWARAAIGRHELRTLKVARFGDNMRNVAVTEGNKVSAEIHFGFSVHGYGIGDLVNSIEKIPENNARKLTEEYKSLYEISPAVLKDTGSMQAIEYQARIELGLKSFLEEGGFSAFTTNFEDLHGMTQLQCSDL
jgi:L-arabinose isomerase